MSRVRSDDLEIADGLRNAIYMFDDHHPMGRPPGWFYKNLLNCIAYADDVNTARLERGYRDLVWAVRTLQREDLGYEMVASTIRFLEGSDDD